MTRILAVALAAAVTLVACALVQPAAAQEDRGVPILSAPYHLPVFRNGSGLYAAAAPAITQSAPGIRIVMSELAESVPGQPDRAMSLRTGEFFWQDAGTTRTVRNTGQDAPGSRRIRAEIG